MLCYDVINPSDATTFLAPDRAVALAALVLVAEGHYAGRAIARDLAPIEPDEALDVPLFLERICTPYEEWCRAAGYTSDPIDAVMASRTAELTAALRSFQYGDLEDRRTYQSALDAITEPAKRAAFVKGWEDRRRSSMNRIVQRAWLIADRLEAKAKPEAAA